MTEQSLSDQNLAEFLKAIELLKQQQETGVAIKPEWRLYYDSETGTPRFYSMNVDEPGTYILVTQEEYERADYAVHVTNGKIIRQVDPRLMIYHASTNNQGILVSQDNWYIPIDATDTVSGVKIELYTQEELQQNQNESANRHK